MSCKRDDADANLVALELAAQAWCTPETAHLAMIPELARAFARILHTRMLESLRFQVRLADTGMKLAKLQKALGPPGHPTLAYSADGELCWIDSEDGLLPKRAEQIPTVEGDVTLPSGTTVETWRDRAIREPLF